MRTTADPIARRPSRGGLVMLLAGAIIVALLGSASSNAARAASVGGTLTVALSTFGTEDVVPSLMTGATMAYAGGMYDFLVGSTPSGALSKTTGLATNWGGRNGGRIWNFTIRSGVKFQDGSPLTARDVKFSLEQVALPTATSSSASTFQRNIKGIIVHSPTKITISFNSPVVDLPELLSSASGLSEGAIIPQTYFQKVGLAGFRAHPIGSGPWSFQSRVVGSSITFTRNNNYWGEKAHYQKLVLDLVADPATASAMLRSGTANIAAIPSSYISQLKSSYQIKTIPNVNGVGFQFYFAGKTPKPAISDIRVREALNLALNRKLINQKIFAGLGTPTSQYPFTPGLPGYNPTAPQYPYNPALAKKLLAQAGQSHLQIDLWAINFPGLPESAQLTSAVAGFWTNIGVTVTQHAIDFPTFRPKYVATPQDFSSAGGDVSIFTSSKLPGLSTAKIYLVSNGIVRIGAPAAGKIDSLYTQASTVVNASARNALLQKMQDIVRTNYLSVPIVAAGQNFAVGPSVNASSWTPTTGIMAALHFETVQPKT